ncbi:hypothetical protein ABMA27_011025 [Loxostege sticticalis]|uniref:BPTI/Kunitz inhibitor domain-containing protein n=1 Tax=Loxostege sticticalis TaxID=481309 RepID=A0ABR3H317_LOXSC
MLFFVKLLFVLLCACRIKSILFYVFNNPDPACEQPIETGPCRAYIQVYGYNKTTDKCERFIYGGCRGNDNRFKTIEECQDACEYNC